MNEYRMWFPIIVLEMRMGNKKTSTKRSSDYGGNKKLYSKKIINNLKQ